MKKLPAASLGITAPLTAGTTFGLGMAINDGDGALVDGVQYGQAGQEGQKGWGGLGAHAIVFGKTPSQTALITLGTNLPTVDRIFLSSVNPGIDVFSFRANDKGASIVDPASAKLVIDGQAVTLTTSPKTGQATDFTFTPASPFPADSEHTYSIDVKDTLGNHVTDTGKFKTPHYGLLTSADKVTPDTSKPGFIGDYFQNEANQNNDNATTELALAGKLIGTDGNPLPNLADPSVPGPATGAGVKLGTAPNKPTISATIVEGGVNKVAAGSLKLSVDGVTVTPTVNSASGTNTVTFTPSAEFIPQTSHTVSLSYTTTAGASRTVSWSFTTTFITRDTLFIEAEDADFGHGQYVKDKNTGMTPPYDGGAYAGLGTMDDEGFDWHANDNAGQAYRPDTALAAGKQNGSAGNDRGYFTVKTWWTLGWNDAGEWYNYTRDFPAPAKDYEIFGHLASGGAPINIEFDQITAGQGQADAQQVKKLLGYFAPGRATAGWDSLEVFQLTDANGKPITVNLGGKTTLRATMLPGSNEDMDYFAFRSKSAAPPAEIKITFTQKGKTMNLAWTGGGTLQQSTVVTGSFTNVANASSGTAAIDIQAKGNLFLRVKNRTRPGLDWHTRARLPAVTFCYSWFEIPLAAKQSIQGEGK